VFKRLDVLLAERKLVNSRQRAKRLIMAGKVFVDGKKLDKPGKNVPIDADIEIQEDMPYVSRGGLKLEKAINHFNIDVRNKVAIDVGASTGGFTDCLLQHGAKFVYAVDVGYGQLAWKLRTDPRVKVIERTNIRYVKHDDLDKRIELATIDVSFISLKKVLPVVGTLLDDKGEIIALIKPQFEAGRHLVGKGGVVKNPEIHKRVIFGLIDFSTRQNYTTAGLTYSPIRGPAGNIEYFIFLKLGGEDDTIDVDSVVPQVIHEAQLMFRNRVFRKNSVSN